MSNANDLCEMRLNICKSCPLYLDSPSGARCNPKLYLNETDKTTVSTRPKIGFKKGCGCFIEKRAMWPNAKCALGKW